jgi:hypothetical protein
MQTKKTIDAFTREKTEREKIMMVTGFARWLNEP